MNKTGFILLAAGSSSRFEGTIRKQFVELSGRSVLRQALERIPELENGVVVIPSEEVDDARNRLESEPLSRTINIVPGGDTRRKSVRNGLEALRSKQIKRVLVHDSARPYMPSDVHERVLESLDTLDATVAGVVPTLPVEDTIKRVRDDTTESYVEETLQRDCLRRVQTPQGFSFQDLYEVHANWGGDPVTDDAMMMESEGYTVATVPGSRLGRKITRREDLAILKELRNRELA